MNRILVILIFAFTIAQQNNATVNYIGSDIGKSSQIISSTSLLGINDVNQLCDIPDTDLDLSGSIEFENNYTEFTPLVSSVLPISGFTYLPVNYLLLHHLDLPPPCLL